MNLETPAGMSLSATRTEALKGFVTEIFARLGVPEEAARLSAAALVAADVEGMSAHGVTLVPLYVERILAGSVSTATEPTVVHDGGSAIVLDAGHSLGQLSSDWALPMVSERAREHGVACIAVRNGSHFGTATFWARQIAESGLIGIVMCNSRPRKPAPGGTERVTGSNSLAIALPSRDAKPFVAELEADSPAADPASAVAALLRANSGARGFGLAAAIDLMCGGLSGGAIGPDVGAFDGDPEVPYRSSHLFAALDPARFGIADLDGRVAQFAERIRKRARRAESGDECLLPPELLARLRECGAKVGVESRLE
jgi:LDH2 family malate/lactate/ureidoglycolate dehydrogenase